ncbi:malonic semialdehyde reductase [Octadecabacter sp. 1_MG-2023]|uniref:malonic semialdehyde reductase n=1 Tax=unclassified Octadecabacter TaxID=196158 RepID=UPI001C0917FB|nr:MULTISPECIES: malonic semialdehyde reductase [unclassified Octadecabacter]MBU2994013.1 malonic semialdehyde reductase [Octadecabacter sp. B2R22]MDO6736044.1 malonic semialdehyde reductase [Octadecabacter sp. 1_MG-2023]
MSEATSLEDLRRGAQEDVRALRGKISSLNEDEIGLILSDARSHYAWTDKPVSDDLLHKIFDITKMGPTSMNTCPARFVFVRTPEGKDKLASALKPANVPKVVNAPVTAIIAYDLDFWTQLPKLFPHEDRRPHFEGKLQHSEDTAFRNSTLQGAYFMIAARALGLDVGAISGFDNAMVDDVFFKGTSLKSNFLCNIGYADEQALFQRLPRFDFDDVCEII